MKILKLNEQEFNDLIVEELTKTEVTSIIRDKFDSQLDSSEFKKKVKEISAEVVSNLFRTLWQQNNMWKRACQQ